VGLLLYFWAKLFLFENGDRGWSQLVFSRKGKDKNRGKVWCIMQLDLLKKFLVLKKRFEELFQGRLPVHLRGLSIKEGITDQYRKAYLLTSYINCCENCRLDSRTLMVVFCLHNDSKRLGSGELFVLFHANYCWVLLTNELLNGGT
jgi:hypothetical protein